MIKKTLNRVILLQKPARSKDDIRIKNAKFLGSVDVLILRGFRG